MVFSQIHANEFALPARIIQPSRQRRIRSGAEADELHPADRLEPIRRGGCFDELSLLRQNEQPVGGKDQRAGAKIILAPSHFAAFEIHATQMLPLLLASIKPIQKTVAVNAGGIMIGKNIVRRPDLFRALFPESKQRAAPFHNRRRGKSCRR